MTWCRPNVAHFLRVALLCGIGLGIGGCNAEVSKEPAAPTPLVSAEDSDSLVANSTGPKDARAANSPTLIPSESVAGRLTSQEFFARFAADPESVVGKTWEVRGFLDSEGNAFRVNKKTLPGFVNLIEFASPPNVADRHPQREFTVRGMADKQGEYPLLKDCTVLAMGPDPEQVVYEAQALCESYLQAPEYEQMRLAGDFLGRENAAIKVRGVVLNMMDQGGGNVTVYLLAGADSGLEIELSDNAQAAVVSRGTTVTFEGEFDSYPLENSKVLRLYSAKLHKEESAQRPIIHPANVVKISATDLLNEVATNDQAFQERLVALTYPGVGRDRIVTKPILVTGTIKQIVLGEPESDASGKVVLGSSDSDATIECEMLAGQSLVELKVGEQIGIIGTYNFSFDDPRVIVSLNLCRIWNADLIKPASAASASP